MNTLTKITLFSFIVSAAIGLIALAQTPTPVGKTDEDYRLGWKDGWMGYSIDSFAIDEFHRECDALPDDTDREAVAEVWRKCLAQSAESEKQWDALTRQQKLDYPMSPFWKRNNGEPRRLSHGPR